MQDIYIYISFCSVYTSNRFPFVSLLSAISESFLRTASFRKSRSKALSSLMGSQLGPMIRKSWDAEGDGEVFDSRITPPNSSKTSPQVRRKGSVSLYIHQPTQGLVWTYVSLTTFRLLSSKKPHKEEKKKKEKTLPFFSSYKEYPVFSFPGYKYRFCQCQDKCRLNVLAFICV